MTNLTDEGTWETAPADLRGRTVVVLGGSGGVGEGVVASALTAGATVIATGRDRAASTRWPLGCRLTGSGETPDTAA